MPRRPRASSARSESAGVKLETLSLSIATVSPLPSHLMLRYCPHSSEFALLPAFSSTSEQLQLLTLNAPIPCMYYTRAQDHTCCEMHAALSQYIPAAAVQDSSIVRLAPGGASCSAQLPRSRRRRCTSRSGTTALPWQGGEGRRGDGVQFHSMTAGGRPGPAECEARLLSTLNRPAAAPAHALPTHPARPTLYFSLRMKCDDQISTCVPSGHRLDEGSGDCRMVDNMHEACMRCTQKHCSTGTRGWGAAVGCM